MYRRIVKQVVDELQRLGCHNWEMQFNRFGSEEAVNRLAAPSPEGTVYHSHLLDEV